VGAVAYKRQVLSLLKFIKTNLPSHKEWNILCVNDWHIGRKVVNEELLNRVLRFVDSNRDNTRIIINGDLLHNINKHSKGAMREQSMNSQEQYDYVADLFKNYVDLIDAVVVGNHDWRTEEETDIDLMCFTLKDT
jgi:metallophosphoesterase superfamily enzyme